MAEGARPTLTELADKYQADKGSKWSRGTYPPHNYTPVYDQMLTKWRDEPLRVLEIGVAEGASLRMWREYFPNAEIFGLDIKPVIEIPGVTVIQGDQGNVFDLHALPGKFDLIVDDGSHLSQHQLTSFYTLCPFKMNPGGVYIIEDMQVMESRGVAMAHFRTQFDIERHYGIAVVAVDGMGRFMAFRVKEDL